MGAAETGLFLDGLRCAGCVNGVERALRAAPGVESAAVNYTTHRALVAFDPERIDVDGIVASVSALGFSATPYDPELLERPGQRADREALIRVLVAAFLAANVMTLALALYIGSFEGLDPAIRRPLRWLAIAISLPAVTWCALPFWRGAGSGLLHGRLTIDVPIVLGIATAFVVNVAGTVAETDHLYVDSAAVIVFLILLGRTLERRARSRAAAAVERLTALTPTTAMRRVGSSLEEVPAAALRPGDVVAVAPGQSFPCDGRIVCGATETDEALLTGESQPVLRETGDEVTGGTRNVLAQVDVEVGAAVDSGTLARLAALLERAQAERPRIQRLADQVAAVFAPAVLLVAGGTAFWWFWAGAAPMEIALTAAAVLIVACPCALGLATPAAVTAAVGRAASLGILVKSGESFERCAAVDRVVLDKTGTLTLGRFTVQGVDTASGVTEDALFAAAATAEDASTHPVARAIVEAAETRGVAFERGSSQRALPGLGVEMGHGESAIRVGASRLLTGSGVEIPETLDESARKWAERGASLAWVARGSRVLGLIALSDPLREDAVRAVGRLQRLGIGVSLVTGDHERAATLACERAGIADGFAGVTPEGKVEYVQACRARGETIAMAGDGINDAAALAAADVGIAMSRGADVALHAADLVVRSSRLGAIADAVELARATLARIRENLGFAVLYNVIAVPLAVSGWLHPLYAALAMSLSSVVVTGNAIRLLRWRPRSWTS